MHHPQYPYPSPVVANMPSVSTQHTHYSHSHSRPQASRVSSSTTEFRGSTNPDEDWTKISDLAERRRIQNRIAQRNYRKKLKRRLEDLERRAASRSLSPNGEDTDGRSTRESSAENPLHSPPPSSEPHLTGPSSRDNYLPPVTGYTTSSNYSSYRPTAGPHSSSYAPAFSSAESSNYSNYYQQQPVSGSSTTTSTTTTTTGVSHAHLPAIADISPTPPHYIYGAYSAPTLSSVVEATCGTPVPTTSGPEHSYLPLPSARLSSYSSAAPQYAAPKTVPAYETQMNPFYMSYAGLADTPNTNYFSNSNYYAQDNHHHHHHHAPSTHSPVAIKQEN